MSEKTRWRRRKKGTPNQIGKPFLVMPRQSKDELPTELRIVIPPRNKSTSSIEHASSDERRDDPYAINKENYEKVKSRIEDFLVERGLIPSKDERRNRRLTMLIMTAEEDNLLSKYKARRSLKKEFPEEYKIYETIRKKES